MKYKIGDVLEVGKQKCLDCGYPHSKRVILLKKGEPYMTSWSEKGCETYRRDNGHCWNCGVAL